MSKKDFSFWCRYLILSQVLFCSWVPHGVYKASGDHYLILSQVFFCFFPGIPQGVYKVNGDCYLIFSQVFFCFCSGVPCWIDKASGDRYLILSQVFFCFCSGVPHGVYKASGDQDWLSADARWRYHCLCPWPATISKFILENWKLHYNYPKGTFLEMVQKCILQM